MRDPRPHRLRPLSWLRGIIVPAALIVAFLPLQAQEATKEKKKKDDAAASPADTAPHRLFREKDKLMQLTITTDLKKFVRMRERGRPPIPATLQYTAGDSGATIPMQIATRGNFRLKERNCSFPPVRLLFDSTGAKKTLFTKQKRLKLVTRCEDSKEFEQYMLREYALYEAYNLLTPLSFRARLVKATYRDSLGKEKPVVTYAFLIEDDGDMAKRNNGKITDAKNAVFEDVDVTTMGVVGFWEYFIGNTDWSVAGLHNVKLVLKQDGNVFPVVYDFDFSGAVDTRYSTPDPQLSIKTVRDRLYRGRCLNDEQLKPVVELFKEKKAAIYAIYDRIPDIDPKYVKETREYFDEFYKTLGDPRLIKRKILEDCQPIGN
jgi:hypothetical protein